MNPERCSLIVAEQVVNQAHVWLVRLFSYLNENKCGLNEISSYFLVYELFFLSCQILISIASNKFIKKIPEHKHSLLLRSHQIYNYT